MADCSSIRPQHVNMQTIRSGCKKIEDTYDDIETAITGLKEALNNLGKKSLQYGTNSVELIENAINEAINELNKIKETNSYLPEDYKSTAETQNNSHDAEIATENERRRNAAKTYKNGKVVGYGTPNLIVCNREK